LARLYGALWLPYRPFRESWLICGRRSGKSFIMALIAVFLACFRDYRPFLAAGEKATIMIIAADKKQARVVLRFVRGLLSAPVLAARVVNDTSESIELEGGVMLEVITASNAVRGYTKPPQAAGMSCYSVAEEITSICADFLVELRGFEPLISVVRAPCAPRG
jgi:hypothetical protein